MLGKPFEDLVEQAFTEGGQAFDDLYRFLYSYLCFMGLRCEAEDIAQEVLLTVWQKWKHDVRDRSRLKSWVLQIAHNRAIDEIRKRRTHLSLDGTGDSDESPLYEFLVVVSSEELPEEHLERAELKRVVWSALEEVSEVHRSCLILRLMQGVAAKEVAHLHHCSVRQVERYVKQGKSAFYAAYQRLVDAQPPAEERRSSR